MDFMDVDYGKTPNGNFLEFHENMKFLNHNGKDVDITMFDKTIYSISDNTKLLGFKGSFGGVYQSENYLINKKNDIINWFSIKKEKIQEYEKKLSSLGIILDDNLCTINFRGGEYKSIPDVLVRRDYWKDSINKMLEINPNMKFIIISDDPIFAQSYMPFEIPVYHDDIGFDFYVVNQSKWLIISNSSFGWWAAWLNKNVKKIIAPKYWSRHNVSDGYWSSGDIYTTSFTYMDRNGNLSDYETCKIESINYFKEQNIL